MNHAEGQLHIRLLSTAECAAAWPRLKELDLRFNKLTSLPPDIVSCISLERLLVAGNKITEIPAGIGESQSRRAAFHPTLSLLFCSSQGRWYLYKRLMRARMSSQEFQWILEVA